MIYLTRKSFLSVIIGLREQLVISGLWAMRLKNLTRVVYRLHYGMMVNSDLIRWTVWYGSMDTLIGYAIL
jgi:hypothetical protein